MLLPFSRSKVDQLHEIVTGNPTVIKMVVSFNRGARGQNALRQILAPVVKEIMEDKSLNIKMDPVDIYKSWVNQMETQTGEARCGAAHIGGCWCSLRGELCWGGADLLVAYITMKNTKTCISLYFY